MASYVGGIVHNGGALGSSRGGQTDGGGNSDNGDASVDLSGIEAAIAKLNRNIINADVDEFPDLSGETEDGDYKSSIVIADGSLYTRKPIIVPSTAADGTWSAFTHADYLGVMGADPDALTNAGKFFYSTEHRSFRQSVDISDLGIIYEWVNLSLSTIVDDATVVFLGRFPSKQTATDAIKSFNSSNTYYALFNGRVETLDNSTYTAGVTAAPAYKWVPDLGRSVVQGVYDSNRDYLRDDVVYVPEKNGHAISMINGNRGNDPATDYGVNWLPLWQRPYPTSIWHGFGQTEALPTEDAAFGSISNVNSNGIKSFTGGTADQIESGGVNVIWTDITDQTNADLTNSGAINAAFQVPAGIYHLRGTFYGNQTPDNDVHLRLVQIISGTDDLVRVVGTPRQQNYLGADTQLHSIYEFRREHLVLENSAIFYVRLVGYSSSQTALVGYVQIEKIA